MTDHNRDDCECGLKEDGTWDDQVFDRFGCGCPRVGFSVNQSGIYAIQEWIENNQDKNLRVFDLWANGIASQIDQCASLNEDVSRNGTFEYETGLRVGRGHMLFISLERKHFDAHEVL